MAALPQQRSASLVGSTRSPLYPREWCLHACVPELDELRFLAVEWKRTRACAFRNGLANFHREISGACAVLHRSSAANGQGSCPRDRGLDCFSVQRSAFRKQKSVFGDGVWRGHCGAIAVAVRVVAYWSSRGRRKPSGTIHTCIGSCRQIRRF